MKLVKDNENESNSQPAFVAFVAAACCVKLVKDNENESNSQLSAVLLMVVPRCVKLVKDNENESNSQPVLPSFNEEAVV